jgi:hypothetical protein
LFFGGEHVKGITNAQADALVNAVKADEGITFTWKSGRTETVEAGGSGVQFTLKVVYSRASDCSGISVTATPTSGATATVQGVTNSSGVAYLTVKQNATYKITSSKTGYTFATSPEVTCSDLTTEVSIQCYIPGTVTVTVTDEKTSVVGRKVTATASGQTTRTQTIAAGQTSVTFSLPAGTWEFTTDYPSGATGAEKKTQAVSNNGTYSLTLKVIYNMVFGFRIAVGTADPSTRVTYPQTIFGQTNGAYGKTPASGTGANCMNDWAGCELITGIKRQKGSAGGGWTDIANNAAWQTGNYGSDMMTYVPTWYMKMTDDGKNIDCAFSQTQINTTWKDYAGSVGTNHIGHFRVGCFAGYLYDNTDTVMLLSQGNVKPTVSKSITNFITYAKARGTGYDIMTWYQWTYLTALAVLLYKSTNLQAAMAQGYVGGSSVQSETALTFSNDYGMAGGTSTTQQMAFFWIQNLWGNMYQLVGGAKTDSSHKLMTSTGYSSVNDSDFDKKSLGGPSSSLNGYISKVVGTTDAGFFPAECLGAATTYFADYGAVNTSRFPYVGGHYNDGGDAGPFLAYFYYSATAANAFIGSRLSYRL